MVLARVVYDSQCGAKPFRNFQAIRRATPSTSSPRWVFDMELWTLLEARKRQRKAPEGVRELN